MKYRVLYELGKSRLCEASISEYELDARLLLEFYCHTKRHDLIINPDLLVTKEQESAYLKAIEQRALRIPLQYITGQQDFMGLTFVVNEHVLIPRQDTEVLVETVLSYTREGMQILDMCTGSGCILLSLLQYTKACEGLGVDISSKALEVAKINHEKLIAFTGKDLKVTFMQSDLFQEITGSFDIIVSNPPYIRSEVIETLEPEVKLHEPVGALDGFLDGLYFYREIIKKSIAFLKPESMLFFEIGHDQGDEVRALMRESGFLEVVVKKDLAGLDRVVFGKWKGI
ncbi:MAG: peptide chain release factor N(5)-glutamine methyltransferase [Lachnospiraceae bacterium]